METKTVLKQITPMYVITVRNTNYKFYLQSIVNVIVSLKINMLRQASFKCRSLMYCFQQFG